MTRLPTESWNITGLSTRDGVQFIDYKCGPLCSVPGCSHFADHVHHITRRSALGGPFSWVRLWDDTITGNLTGLCFQHHNEITENKTRIEWIPAGYVWTGDSEMKFLLEPQPPILRPGATEYDLTPPKREQDLHEHGPGGVEKCPTCSRALPRARSKREGTRNRERWSITVPVDARENGADILDTLVEECQKIFHHNETNQTRYFTLVQALALVVQNQERLLGDD